MGGSWSCISLLRTLVTTRKDYFGCPGESALFVRRIKLKTYASSLSLLMPLPKREYNAVSAIADKIRQYRTDGNLMIFDKDYDTAKAYPRTASSPPKARFLQPSIRLRYNYYVQLVAIKRDWMREPNLKSCSARSLAHEEEVHLSLSSAGTCE